MFSSSFSRLFQHQRTRLIPQFPLKCDFSPYYTPQRFIHAKRRKIKFNQLHGREKRRLKNVGRRKVHATWDTDRLMRVYGESFGQRSARRNAKFANRMRFMWNWSANMQPKHRKRHRRWRRPRANLREGHYFDPRFRAKPEDELGPDAIFKYKPTPLHIKFQHFAVHPRPIESNLITGNEKVADKILPPDYLDKIFNAIPQNKLEIADRYQITQYNLLYDLDTYRKKGLLQKLIARLFTTAMPHTNEQVQSLRFLDRRLFVASNQVWLFGAWVTYTELTDFFSIFLLYTLGVFLIAFARAELEVEHLQSQTIYDPGLLPQLPLYEKKRVIRDSDRTKKPTFEPISPVPRMPLLD